MINDLLDVYYYIKSTKKIEDLENWMYITIEARTLVGFTLEYYPFNWYINVSKVTGQIYNPIIIPSKTKRLLQRCRFDINQLYTTPMYAFWNRVDDGILSEENKSNLLQYLSTEEVAIIDAIYIEMHKLEKRSIENV